MREICRCPGGLCITGSVCMRGSRQWMGPFSRAPLARALGKNAPNSRLAFVQML